MPGPYQRDEKDATGRRIDAAERVVHFMHRELRSLKELSGEPETMPQLFYAAIVAWFDGQADGPLPYQESKLDMVERALLELNAAFIPCPGCQRLLDRDTCHCGIARDDHNALTVGHSFVPMGCVCGYAKEDS